MNENHYVSETSSPFDAPVGKLLHLCNEVSTPEVLALREARQRALEARRDAEKALHEAEEAEARLLVQEEQAIAAAIKLLQEQAAEAVRVAAENDRLATDYVATIEAEFLSCSQSKAEIEAATRSVMESRDEAQRVLDRLVLSLAEIHEKLSQVEEHERRLEAELVTSRQHAEKMTRAREQAEAAIPSLAGPVVLAVVPSPVLSPPASNVSAACDSTLLDARAQRAAERRAADAARAQ